MADDRSTPAPRPTHGYVSDLLREAEAADRWASLLRHELRTPLVGIVGLAGQLRKAALSAGDRALLEALIVSANQLDRLVERLVPPGPRDDEPDCVGEPPPCVDDEAVIALEGFFETLLLAHWPAARSATVDLYLVLGPELAVSAAGPGGRLRAILDNLLANALQATPAGHVLVRVMPGTAGSVVITVEDTGCGMPAGAGRSLTAWGARGAGEAERRPAGSGIGLYVCNWLAGELGGTFRHYARPGGGTVFELALPLRPMAPRVQGLACPAALADLRCRVVLPEPQGTAAASLLQRIGVTVDRDSVPVPPDQIGGSRVMLCRYDSLTPGLRQRIVRETGGRTVGSTPAWLVLGRGQGSGTAPVAARCPEPLVRSVIEPWLLETVLSG